MDDWVEGSIWLSLGRHVCCLCSALIRSAGDCQLKECRLELPHKCSSPLLHQYLHRQLDTLLQSEGEHGERRKEINFFFPLQALALCNLAAPLTKTYSKDHVVPILA